VDDGRDHRPRDARRRLSVPDAHGGPAARLRGRHRVPEHDLRGHSQFRDPWLDEAFASWAEAVVDEQSAFGYEAALQIPGEVGASVAAFPDYGTYSDVVYGKGAAALLAARAAAGPEAFDAAIRCYVDAAAWSIATPEDVYAALADLPAALRPLIDAQALGKDDVPR
jgi:hypothetical protein